jgi:hypothetical protein
MRLTLRVFFCAEELCDMVFSFDLMTDPVVASDGFTYEREAIEKWFKTSSNSPRSGALLQHKILIPNIDKRQQIIAWRELQQSDLRISKVSKAGGGAAAVPPVRGSCRRHPGKHLEVFCMQCRHGVCTICAVDSGICKPHKTFAFVSLIEELKTDTESWERAQLQCDATALEQLCAAIQADGDYKIRAYNQAIAVQVAKLKQQGRAAFETRSASIGAIVQRQKERQERVVVASASPDVAVKGSADAAAVVAAVERVKMHVPLTRAAEFHVAPAPAAVVGQVYVAAAVVDTEGQAEIAAIRQREVNEGHLQREAEAFIAGHSHGNASGRPRPASAILGAPALGGDAVAAVRSASLPFGKCFRCGRSSHFATTCYAKTHVNGHLLH